MKRILIIGVIFMFLISGINAVDVQTMISCGGDEELTINCIGDEELFFVGEESSPVIVTPPPPGGGGGSSAILPLNLDVTPTEFDIDLALGTKIEKTITVTNLGTSSLNISISQIGLEGMVIPRKNSLYLISGETQSFNVAFIDKNQTGIFTGKILIGNKQISVALNVRTKLLLFDSNIVVLDKTYEIRQDGKLHTKVTLIPMGDRDRLDVTLNYIIKDYNDKIYLTQSETVLVEEQIEFEKNFDTGGLPPGEYIIGLEIIYPNGVATSSSHFQIIEQTQTKKIISYTIIPLSIILILIITILFIRFLTKKMKKINKIKAKEDRKKINKIKAKEDRKKINKIKAKEDWKKINKIKAKEDRKKINKIKAKEDWKKINKIKAKEDWKKINKIKAKEDWKKINKIKAKEDRKKINKIKDGERKKILNQIKEPFLERKIKSNENKKIITRGEISKVTKKEKNISKIKEREKSSQKQVKSPESEARLKKQMFDKLLKEEIKQKTKPS